METADRVRHLRRAGLGVQATAAILNLTAQEIADTALDPASAPVISFGGGQLVSVQGEGLVLPAGAAPFEFPSGPLPYASGVRNEVRSPDVDDFFTFTPTGIAIVDPTAFYMVMFWASVGPQPNAVKFTSVADSWFEFGPREFTIAPQAGSGSLVGVIGGLPLAEEPPENWPEYGAVGYEFTTVPNGNQVAPQINGVFAELTVVKLS